MYCIVSENCCREIKEEVNINFLVVIPSFCESDILFLQATCRDEVLMTGAGGGFAELLAFEPP